MNTSGKSTAREFDIIVWGASGFTGRLVAEYLAKNYSKPNPDRRVQGGSRLRYGKDEYLRWAAAGRNVDKVRTILADIAGSGDPIPIVTADSNDEKSLNALAHSTRVVLSTVGPYARYGSHLVAACVANGTHYCDLAGETQWMQAMINQHQDNAIQSGARIVHSCGFDSIPSDIGTLLLQRAANERFNQPCQEVTLLVKAIKGGASGGTIASMLTAIEQARKDRNIARALANPYALNPEGQREGPDGRDQTNIRYNAEARTWTGPFVMAAVNTRIVRRSNALLHYAYGEDFRYHEATMTGPGWRGWVKASLLTTFIGIFMLASSNAWMRRHIVKRLMPKPGEGPDKASRENGFFNLKLFGRTRDGQVVKMTVKGDRDPGYGSTSKMLAEAAVCLARDNVEVSGGFWTPATALGNKLAIRLVDKAGLSFDLH